MERRVAVRKPIICRMEGSAGEQTFTADGCDMSETGISFACPQLLPVHSEATLRYRMQHNGPLVIARVLIRQQSGHRYGAKFLDRRVAPMATD
ncbi:MAG: PilZ domain-containing protein [Terriglobales bacterium]